MSNVKKVSLKQVQTIVNKIEEAIKKSPTGVSFVSIKGYENSQGEKSNVLINIGMNYENVKDKDFDYLKTVDISTIVINEEDETKKEAAIALLKDAKEALIASQIKPSVNHVNGQKDAYTRVPSAPQIKIHNETGQIYIEGYQQKKTVLIEGEYKTVNSRPLTIAKDAIRKGMRASKIRQYKLESIENLTLSGTTIEI